MERVSNDQTRDINNCQTNSYISTGACVEKEIVKKVGTSEKNYNFSFEDSAF